MDWSRERYVRLYTRDTGTWALLSWQARCTLPLLMRKLDRAGKLSIPGKAKPEAVVAKLLDVPVRVVKAGLEDLAEAGIVELTVSGLAMPNFADAQETRAPSTERVRRHRDRKNGEAANSETFQKHDETDRVSDETPSRAVPCLAVPSLAVPPPPTPAGAELRERWRWRLLEIRSELSQPIDPLSDTQGLSAHDGLVELHGLDRCLAVLEHAVRAANAWHLSDGKDGTDPKFVATMCRGQGFGRHVDEYLKAEKRERGRTMVAPQKLEWRGSDRVLTDEEQRYWMAGASGGTSRLALEHRLRSQWDADDEAGDEILARALEVLR